MIMYELTDLHTDQTNVCFNHYKAEGSQAPSTLPK